MLASSTPAPARAAAKWGTVTLTATSAADRAHRAVRLHEVRVVDAVSRRLGPHRGPPRGFERIVVGAGAPQRAQVGLLPSEQAVAHLAVRGEPGRVTGRSGR